MIYQNETYLISFLGYTSGHFIKTMVRQFIEGNPNEILTFPSDGTAHKVEGFINGISNTNIRCGKLFYRVPQNYIILEHNLHEYIQIFNNEPFIWAEHTPPNWKTLFEKFPNAKNIIIQSSEKSLLRILANVHYKQLQLPEYQKELLKTFSNLDYIDHESWVKKIYENYISKSNQLYKYPYHLNDSIPYEYTNKIYPLDLHDIIHNQDKVLDLLSNVTGRPCLPNFTINYNSYLDSQKKLIPWLDDK